MRHAEIFTENIAGRAVTPAIHRLLEVWASFDESYGYAPFAPFDPSALGSIADDMIVIASRDNGEDAYLFYGRSVAADGGVDMTGKSVGEFKSAFGQFFRESNQRAIVERRPVFTVHQRGDTRPEEWERLVLPCRHSDGSDRVVIFSKKRSQSNDLLAAILDASLHGILAVRLVRNSAGEPVDGEVTLANRRAAYFAGRPLDEMTGARVLTLFPDLLRLDLWSRYVEVAESRKPLEFVTLYPSDGGTRWFEVSVVPIGDGFMVTYADITVRKANEDAARQREREVAAANEVLQKEIARRQELEAELSRLATLDPLTGARNRRAIAEGLQNALSLSERYGHPISVFVLDLDDFKRINDSHGHAAGDIVLRSTASILTHGLREDVDLIGRLGGEEFIAILPHTGLEGATLVAERIRKMLEKSQVAHKDHWLGCTGSFGVACWDGREHPDRLLSRADEALYRAKSAGRNLVAVDEGSTGTTLLHAEGTASSPLGGEKSPVKRTRRSTPPRRKADPRQG